MQTQLEGAILRMSFVGYTTRSYKGISEYVDFMIQVQNDLATAFLDASEEEDFLWRKQLFDVENEINYHDALLFIYKMIRQHRRGLTVVFIQSLNKEIKSWMDDKERIKEMDENVRYGLQGFYKKEVIQILRGLRDAENQKMIENGEYAIHLFNLCDAYLAYGTKKSLLFKVALIC
ncbi:hypothetical protein CsatA_000932 [Cannabis sativa]